MTGAPDMDLTTLTDQQLDDHRRAVLIERVTDALTTEEHPALEG